MSPGLLSEIPLLILGCILSYLSNDILCIEGLAMLFWKAVFKESIKNTYSLIEKVCLHEFIIFVRECNRHTKILFYVQLYYDMEYCLFCFSFVFNLF